MGWYNVFTTDENGNPRIISTETDKVELSGLTEFKLPNMNAEQRQEYFKRIRNSYSAIDITELLNEAKAAEAASEHK